MLRYATCRSRICQSIIQRTSTEVPFVILSRAKSSIDDQGFVGLDDDEPRRNRRDREEPILGKGRPSFRTASSDRPQQQHRYHPQSQQDGDRNHYRETQQKSSLRQDVGDNGPPRYNQRSYGPPRENQRIPGPVKVPPFSFRDSGPPRSLPSALEDRIKKMQDGSHNANRTSTSIQRNPWRTSTPNEGEKSGSTAAIEGPENENALASLQNASWKQKLQQQLENSGRPSLMETLQKKANQYSQSDQISKPPPAFPGASIASSQATRAVSERLNSTWKLKMDIIKELGEKQRITTNDTLLATFKKGSHVTPLANVSEVPKKDTFAHDSMMDVLDLRNAFIKGQEAEKNRKRIQAEAGNTANAEAEQVVASASSTHEWRVPGGAKEFREKLIAEKEAAEQRAHEQVTPRISETTGAVNLQQRVKDSVNKRKLEEMKRRRQQGQMKGKDIEVHLPSHDLSVRDLSTKLRFSQDMIMTVLRAIGERPIDENSKVNVDNMELVAMELGLEPIRSKRRVPQSISEADREILLRRRADGESVDDELLAKYEALPPRPPVVCLMGHVDHGKTTLMDALRRRGNSGNLRQAPKAQSKKAKTANKHASADDVAGTEAGGITQAISAFQVMLEAQGTAVTFLDTPGHAAFRAMRESGSHAADVIVLVIAADDGVSRQTIEILDFFKSIVTGTGGGGISLVIAMTKIDKPGIDAEASQRRIENQLLEHGILTESFGGSGEFGPPAQLLPVSGITGEGLDELIEGLALQSEIMDLRADPDARAEGIVMDARIDKSHGGVVADCIIRWGSLERGDIIVSGTHVGKVKALKDPTNALIKRGGPSQPVRVIGFKTTPKAGDPLVVVENEEKAHALIAAREALQARDPNYTEDRPEVDNTGAIEVQISGVSAQRPHMLARLFDKHGIDVHAKSTQIRIPVVLKADADGTLAALKESIVSLGTNSQLDLVIDPIVVGVGQLTQSDILTAGAAKAAIFTFNLKNSDAKIMSLIEEEKLEFKSGNIIYTLINDAKEVFQGYLPEKAMYHIHGKGVVQAVFEINNKSDAEKIAGLMVKEGTLYTQKTKHPNGTGTMECYYRVIRGGEIISPKAETVKCKSLRRVKEIVESIRFGLECGLGLDGFEEFEVGDTIECYSVEMQRQSI